ncbi:MAG: serine hydrolase [Clostridiales bacterium]|nr:serine hydrolase [Clostridiales bacterium]
MVVCLFVCMLCVILDIVFITKLMGKGKNSVKATTDASSSVLTDASGNIISDPSADPSDTTEPAATSTAVQTVDAETRAANLAALSANVNDYLSKQSGRYSVYYLNLNNGETLAYKETTPYIAASAIKLAYNTYLYEKVAAGEIDLSEKMAYNAAPYPEGDLEYGTGTIQNSADGTEYTLQQVSTLSITISDNCATNMLLRRLGGEDAVNNSYMKPISCVVDYREKVTYTDYCGNSVSGRRRTCALDLALYAQHLYQDYQNNPEAFQPLINDLCNTEYNWGVADGVPSDISVAHKVGFRDQTYNDIGIVFATEDYVLCFTTETGDAVTAQQVMREVSRMIYEYVVSNYA